MKAPFTPTPVLGLLVTYGYHGVCAAEVAVVGITPRRFRIKALLVTRLSGRGRFIQPGQTALVPKTAVRILGGPIELEKAEARAAGRLRARAEGKERGG